jgi:transcription antitermination factor NusG
MPILPAEPEMYPSTLWQEDRTQDDFNRRWWCLHTKPRQEKTLARALHKRGVSHYLPQIVYESRTPGGRKIRSLIPLFPGYMFLYGDDYQRVGAIQGNHLANILEVPNQAALEQDLRQIHQMLSSGLPIAPEPTHVVGATIRILTGPLKGLTGTVVRRGCRDRFEAQVRFLGRGVTVDLQDWQVETVQDRPLAACGRPSPSRAERHACPAG